MRSERTSGMAPSLPILPASAADWIGESGGTYQTIGKVRYSGCRGKATFHSIAIFHTGDFFAASSQASGTPSSRACAIHLGIVRIEEDIELRLIQILLVFDARRLLDAVSVVKHNAQIAYAPNASL